MTTETTKTETTRTIDETTEERNARWTAALVRAIHKIRRRASVDRIVPASGIGPEIAAYLAANRWAGNTETVVRTLIREARCPNVARHYARGSNSYSWVSDAKLAAAAADAAMLAEEDRRLREKIARVQDALRAAGFAVLDDPSVRFNATFEGLHFDLAICGGK